jgi:adenine-specific DNA-methyltransferase
VISQIELIRQEVSRAIEPKKKAHLGQFFTSAKIANFMASLFVHNGKKKSSLLDAGAGVGSLTCAFLSRANTSDFQFGKIDVLAYEVDNELHNYLKENIERFCTTNRVSYRIEQQDFIFSIEDLSQSEIQKIDYAILNPPYKKINTGSSHRIALSKAGIETVNLYSAFVALAILKLKAGGQLVAIIPRSFCNGPYYRSFREFIFKETAIRQIHLFNSRKKQFKEDDVLQENVIIHLEKSRPQKQISISTSSDDTFCDYHLTVRNFSDIVIPSDFEKFIHIPTDAIEINRLEDIENCSLADLNIQVSTGPVVDFRVKDSLCKTPIKKSVPLIYPTHFSNGRIHWPKPDQKKPNALLVNSETEKSLFPAGHYVVVRRFSSKEEKRRIVACLVNPKDFEGYSHIGFENHLNVYHCKKNGLPEKVAKGLLAYLNSPKIDEAFRRFSGHTQVNATDLRSLKYPSLVDLIDLGKNHKFNKKIVTKRNEMQINLL